MLDGPVANAYALVRPPGHHALPGSGMGFCLFANVAVAVRHAQAERGTGRVAVVDWDVHHGNGTQAVFEDDPSVLAISLHQDGLYPARSGGLEQNGTGAGEGATLNVPLPAGSGRGAYLAALERVVVPALERFRPELIVVACGFDAGALDPLGRMLLSAAAFGELTGGAARRGRTACAAGDSSASHEGGYAAGHVPFCGLAVIERLSGESAGVEDPFAYLGEIRGRSCSRTRRQRSRRRPVSWSACRRERRGGDRRQRRGGHGVRDATRTARRPPAPDRARACRRIDRR